jgi:hypothetical protein
MYDAMHSAYRALLRVNNYDPNCVLISILIEKCEKLTLLIPRQTSIFIPPKSTYFYSRKNKIWKKVSFVKRQKVYDEAS